MAPTTMRGGTRMAPITLAVTGSERIILPLLSLTVILRTLPSLIRALILLTTFLPSTLNSSWVFLLTKGLLIVFLAGI